MLTCREVTAALASDELEAARWWKRAVVRLHLVRCRHCREYAAQLRAIGAAARRLFRRGEEEPERLARLEREILGVLERESPGGDDPEGGGG